MLVSIQERVGQAIAAFENLAANLQKARATVANIAVTMPQQHSSTAQDLKRGRPSEIDHLNGYILQRGQALGVPTPVNRVLHALVKLLEKPV